METRSTQEREHWMSEYIFAYNVYSKVQRGSWQELVNFHVNINRDKYDKYIWINWSSTHVSFLVLPLVCVPVQSIFPVPTHERLLRLLRLIVIISCKIFVISSCSIPSRLKLRLGEQISLWVDWSIWVNIKGLIHLSSILWFFLYICPVCDSVCYCLVELLLNSVCCCLAELLLNSVCCCLVLNFVCCCLVELLLNSVCCCPVESLLNSVCCCLVLNYVCCCLVELLLNFVCCRLVYLLLNHQMSFHPVSNHCEFQDHGIAVD